MAINVQFSLVDGYGRSASKRFEGTQTLLADAITDGDALWDLFAAVSDMGSSNQAYTQNVAAIVAAGAGANVDAGATIHCRLNNGKGYAFKIPAIKPALVNADGSIDIAAAAITNFIAQFQVGGNYTVSEGNTVAAILYGELDR